LPVKAGQKIWLYGVDAAAAQRAGLTVVADPADADAALVRMGAPSELLHPHSFFGKRQNEGRLDYRPGDPGYDAIVRAASARLPVIVAIDMDRPAILTNVKDKAAAILAIFGASDDAVLDVIMGNAVAKGRLPFELPSSMAAVEAQDPALSDDSAGPLYPVGAGIVR